MKRTQALRPQTGPQEVSLLQAHLTVSRLFVLHTHSWLAHRAGLKRVSGSF